MVVVSRAARLIRAAALAGLVVIATVPAAAGNLQTDAGIPRILLDVPARAVEYQLARLTVDELQRVDRRVDDPRYRPVYMALLTRAGVAAAYRDEAVQALSAMLETRPTEVLLEALGVMAPDEQATIDQLARRLLGQPVDTLRSDRTILLDHVAGDAPASSVGAAYAARLVTGDDVDEIWASAVASGHLAALLGGLRFLGDPVALARPRARMSARIIDLVDDAGTPPDERVAAIEALGWTGNDPRVFDRLADVIEADAEPPAARAAAVRSLLRLPEVAPSPGRIESLAATVVDRIAAMAPEQRTEPDGSDALRLGEWLADALPPEPARALRRELRALGVRVVALETVYEEMRYDLWWFVVEAGRPVEIVFSNRDAMPHNVVIGAPGSLQEIGMAAGVMPLPDDPDVRPYVPDLPSVLAATRLLAEGEVERLGFVAPDDPGEYVFACTFPGHWVRMYGVMLVVPDRDVWESAPTVPIDPMTRTPFPSAVR